VLVRHVAVDLGHLPDARAHARLGFDGLDGALVRLRDRGVSLVTDQIRPDQGVERAVAAVLSWRATEAVARAASDAVDLLADDALEGAALLCLDRLPSRQAEGPGVPLESRVQTSGDVPSGLFDGVLLVDRPEDLLDIKRGIGVLADGRGFDADRGIAFRAGDAAGRTLARKRDLAGVEQQVRDDQAARTAAAAALADATRHRESVEQAEGVTRAAVATARDTQLRLERELGEAGREAERERPHDVGAIGRDAWNRGPLGQGQGGEFILQGTDPEGGQTSLDDRLADRL
jgi:chromosome segregation ATPase